MSACNVNESHINSKMDAFLAAWQESATFADSLDDGLSSASCDDPVPDSPELAADEPEADVAIAADGSEAEWLAVAEAAAAPPALPVPWPSSLGGGHLALCERHSSSTT